jgi:hypothetical protein
LRDLPGVKILNSEDPEQSCAIGFVSVDGFDAPKLQNYLWSKHRIWTVAIVTPDEYQGLRITPNVYTTDRMTGSFRAIAIAVATAALASAQTAASDAAKLGHSSHGDCVRLRTAAEAVDHGGHWIRTISDYH